MFITSCGSTTNVERFKYLKYFKFDITTNPIVTTDVRHGGLDKYDGALPWVVKPMFWTKSATKLYMGFNSQLSLGSVHSCIVTFNLPYDPTNTGNLRQCRSDGFLYCGTKGYGCTAVNLAGLDYYDKLIGALNYDLRMQDGTSPAGSPYPITKMIAECGSIIDQVILNHIFAISEIRLVKAFNSTDNYLGWFN